jgi:hypothetical protein
LRGKRTDQFDQILNQKVEDPAAPALKKLAAGAVLDPSERSAVACFIALTAARSPEAANNALAAQLDRLTPVDRAELDELIQLWCGLVGRPLDPKAHAEFMKPSSLGAMWVWSKSLQRRVLAWDWHVVTTAKESPFVTSDRPVFAQEDGAGPCVVSFPVSSEVALIIIAGGYFREPRDTVEAVSAVNRQTMHRAREFVVACKEGFPGDDALVSLSPSA